MNKDLVSTADDWWQDTIDVDVSTKIGVTDETVRQMQEYAGVYGGSARMDMGKILTDKELEARQKEKPYLP